MKAAIHPLDTSARDAHNARLRPLPKGAVMIEDFSYSDYVADEAFLASYNAYQARYAETIRESDKVLIAMVRDFVGQADGRRLRILDIGCSTGNLLLHLKRFVPEVDYVGGDLAQSSLQSCRSNPTLVGIDFECLDILDLPAASYDVIVVNAVLYMLDADQLRRALASLRQALRSEGRVLIYDFAHPFEHQDLVVYETSMMHPHGLRLCFRPMAKLTRSFMAAGFAQVDFFPFRIPIDLPLPGYDEEVTSYTVDQAGGARLLFRGALFQPWCHMVAR